MKVSGGKIDKALLIAIPVMLQQLIQSLVSLSDNFMVSGLGDVSMSGVNVAGQVLFVFMIFVNTICMSDRSCQGGDIPLLVEEGTVA